MNGKEKYKEKGKEIKRNKMKKVQKMEKESHWSQRCGISEVLLEQWLEMEGHFWSLAQIVLKTHLLQKQMQIHKHLALTQTHCFLRQIDAYSSLCAD